MGEKILRILFIIVCITLFFNGCESSKVRREREKREERLRNTHVDKLKDVISPIDYKYSLGRIQTKYLLSTKQIGGYKVLKSFFIPSIYGRSEKYHLKLERVSDRKRIFPEVSEELFLAVDEGVTYPVIVEKEK